MTDIKLNTDTKLDFVLRNFSESPTFRSDFTLEHGEVTVNKTETHLLSVSVTGDSAVTVDGETSDEVHFDLYLQADIDTEEESYYWDVWDMAALDKEYVSPEDIPIFLTDLASSILD